MRKLPEAELEVMVEIWKSKEPICRFDLQDSLAEHKWAASTILTLLARLEAKGYVESTKKGKVKYYVPLVSAEDYAARESQTVLQRFFGNSLKHFVACMTKQENFSDEELEELRLFLEEQKSKKEKDEKSEE